MANAAFFFFLLQMQCKCSNVNVHVKATFSKLFILFIHDVWRKLDADAEEMLYVTNEL